MRFSRNWDIGWCLPDTFDPPGVDQQAAAFCFPVEIAHGFITDLLQKDPNILFLPHIRGVPTDEENPNTCTCVFVQGEAFYLGYHLRSATEPRRCLLRTWI